ncbi:MAG: hypothetical protein H7Y43_05890 [Akkermansiaceae bacterium]|nr:hypothetical protein [Verrucomicrobiales bacterium]
MSDDKLHEAVAPYRAEFKSEFQPLIDELYREEVLEARRMSAETKFLAGESLFFSACEITLAGIQHQNPEFGQEQCRAELQRRLKLREWMDWNE